ncbi:NAD(P)/FAD-dependent oxidoreductase [Feifania hominis]|uniref:FAD-binding protein n=1 Tax=Feifania hominis TaxID=2763660 RepID=A0A926HQM7_9FIRM|nr:FAD-binding protein [Feifania hominis]MBC8536507.1 FAD-binding protein [Feifania hominis]
MIRINNIALPLDASGEELTRRAAKKLHVGAGRIAQLRLVKKAVDARDKSDVHFVCSVDVSLHGDEQAALLRAGRDCRAVEPRGPWRVARVQTPAVRPVVVGAGPAGLFAALTLARAGARPILLERGRAVEERRRMVDSFWAGGALDAECNVQFGEGGAGTFSDGKLTTGIKDPRIGAVLHDFVLAGAPAEIEYLAKPHIGTDYLEMVVRGLRREICERGGEVRFGHRLDGLELSGGALAAALVREGGSVYRLEAHALILAIGHSARDTFAMLERLGVPMQAKPFSIGLRAEHPQRMIDRSQYGPFAGHPALGPADYKLACHLPDGRSAYTFCMCPGGSVVASSSGEGEIVVNGMSNFRRDGVNANSALLVPVGPEDFAGAGPLAGVDFQRRWERLAFSLGGGSYRAPAQLVGDFLRGTPSAALGDVVPSYRPGVTLGDLSGCLPGYAAETLRRAVRIFARSIEGFDRPDAVLTGVETRSSSPVRILRGGGFCSPVAGLYPCGEGAGYAGGITSAAVDGMRCAEAVLAQYAPAL